MAYLTKHKKSPFWYLRKLDPDTGKWTEKTTGFKISNQLETRRAQVMAQKAGTGELQLAEGRQNARQNPAFNAWVPIYLIDHYANKSPGTARRMETAWAVIKRFLNTVDVTYPRQVRFHHGEDYIKWRKENPVHGRITRHNTALLEVKFLSQLLNESIRREYCEANPLLRLGIARTPQKVKPELSDEDIKKLRAYLANRAPWMLICFNISLYTGCRFSECEIARENIDLDAGTIRICDAKRPESDPKKYFTVPIHPGLRPTLAAFIDSGAPSTVRLTSREFNTRINRAFKQAGVDASFHSLRVTFVTRCHRGGLSQVEAMRLVNHTTQLVHRIYSRLNVDDVREAQAKIPLPAF